MRTRHPAHLAGRIICWLIEPHPIDHEAIDQLIEHEAAREAQATAQTRSGGDGLRTLGPEQARA